MMLRVWHKDDHCLECGEREYSDKRYGGRAGVVHAVHTAERLLITCKHCGTLRERVLGDFGDLEEVEEHVSGSDPG